MTNNKFWLVWNEAGNAPNKRHNTEEFAYVEARRLASMYPQHEYVVLRAVRSFKADVNVVETDLTVPEVEPTAPTETLTPKFKVGDFVEYQKRKYVIIGVLPPSENDYSVGFKKIYAYHIGSAGIVSEDVLSPWEDESP